MEKLLILVHPDILLEKWGFDLQKSKEYCDRVRDAIPEYKHVYTILFFSPKYVEIALENDSISQEVAEVWQKLKSELNSPNDGRYSTYSAKYKFGQDIFSNKIGMYLIDNPDLDVYFGGGYENLCVKDTQEAFCNILYSIYNKPLKKDSRLIIKTRHGLDENCSQKNNKITYNKLKQIIKEELQKVLKQNTK